MKFWARQTGHIAYRPAIDGLRAVAILSVVGFHAFPAWLPGGFIGVDIFFVISGFLISDIVLGDLRRGQFSLAGFYARRIRRIFPALLLVLGASLIAGWFILWPGEYLYLAKQTAGGAGFIANLLFARETGYFDGHPETKPLLHLWSLGVEEQFYIFWPLMLAAAWKWGRRAGFLIVAIIIASFAVNIWLAGSRSIVDFYSPLSRFWELLVGGALAWAAQHRKISLSRLFAEIAAFTGIALIIAADFLLNQTMIFPGWLAVLPVMGAALLIAAGEGVFINHKILAHPAVVFVGLISYPLYLWHWPLLSFAQIIVGEAPARPLRIEMAALAFALAMLTYYLVERPIRKNARGQKIILILLALMFAVGGAAGTVMLTKGLPSRFADAGFDTQMLDSATLIDQWRSHMRLGQCHLEDVDAAQQTPDCIEATRPLVLLWGDSHAASLYPGLKALQADHAFGIAQLTQAACPPLLDLSAQHFRANCNLINRRILTQAAALKPELIILASAWQHPDYPMSGDEIIKRLKMTVARIKQETPQSRIIVIGPAPRWLSPLPALYRRAFTFGHHALPERLDQHLDPALAGLETQMRDQLTAAGISYLSQQEQLCDAAGCLTRLGPGLDSISFIDNEHVSALAATYEMQKFAPQIFAAIRLAP